MDRRTDRQTDGWIEKDPNSDDQTDGHIEVDGRIDKSVDYMFFLLGALGVKVSGNCQCYRDSGQCYCLMLQLNFRV